MKRLATVLALALGCISALWGEARATLTSLRDIHALTNADARHAIPVLFQATVTYYRGYEKVLFVQDGDAAIFVLPNVDGKLTPGDRVLVHGKTQESFRPLIVADDITVLHHGQLPKPVPAAFDEMIRAQLDCRYVTVRAVVRAADAVLSPAAPIPNISLQLIMDGGHIEAMVDGDNEGALRDLLGTEVEVTGAESGEFDNKMQQTAVSIHVSTLANVKVLKRVTASPWSLPVTPMDQILSTYHVQDLTQMIRVHGTITYYQPGTAVVLQDGDKSLWVATHTHAPLGIGDVADATGFPDSRDFVMTLTDGEVQDSRVKAPITPLKSTWPQLALWDANKPTGHLFDLVSLEGKVVTEVREAAQDEYVVSANGQLFTAVYRHPSPPNPVQLMLRVPLGSKVSVTGICIIVDANRFNKGRDVPFDILLRTFDDIEVVAAPSFLTIRNLMILVGLLFAVVVVLLLRGWIIERKVRRQTSALAHLESRRRRILEDINASRPLTEIIGQITDLVSFELKGAPCWCQIADGPKLGGYSSEERDLRIIRMQIPGRSGPPLGTLFVGFSPLNEPSLDESDALPIGVGLATLAIETRRIYSDLTHRSEFDLLTDIHNRFSLERYLDTRIDWARLNAGMFGLVFVDLNDFKQVNDTYGHCLGDRYLQQSALRMKRQLRSSDMLARLGGDEFAVLVGVVRNRADVEEIALRLERCFDEPYVFEGITLQGSASMGIALYPEDAESKDGLLSTADAAMYAAKHARRRSSRIPGVHKEVGFPS